MSLNRIDSADNVVFDLAEDITERKTRVQFIPAAVSTKAREESLYFDKWHGYYREIPELQAVIDRLATWVVYGGDDNEGKQSDITFSSKADEARFKSWVGNGKDTPKQILFNLFRQGKICGNSVAEIIRSKKKGVINLKPLNPQTIKVFANEKGFLVKFQQNPVNGGKQIDLDLDQVFYLPWNRIADEIIGISTVEKLQRIIDFRHQGMNDMAEVFHRYVVPFWLFYADTDDAGEIADFKAKVKQMVKQRDHMVIPDKTITKHEMLSVPQFSTLDPLNWIKHLERYFLLSEGVPEIISGIGRETADASSRMIYLSWRIITIANQKIFEEALESQIGIKLRFPRPINILAPEVTEEKTKVIGDREKKEEVKNEKAS